MIVVKLGGSLAEAGTLRGWFMALTRGMGRAIVVPGGGAFAEAVREQQRRLQFSDRAAHRMALLAMEQYANVLADICAQMTTCASESEMHTALARPSVPVWLPSAMALAEPDIPPSWDVTSDSLAAWLVGERVVQGLHEEIRSRTAPARSSDMGRARHGRSAFPAISRKCQADAGLGRPGRGGSSGRPAGALERSPWHPRTPEPAPVSVGQ